MKAQRTDGATGKLPKERAVFIITKTEQIDDNADRQQCFTASWRRGFDAERQEMIEENRVPVPLFIYPEGAGLPRCRDSS